MAELSYGAAAMVRRVQGSLEQRSRYDPSTNWPKSPSKNFWMALQTLTIKELFDSFTICHIASDRFIFERGVFFAVIPTIFFWGIQLWESVIVLLSIQRVFIHVVAVSRIRIEGSRGDYEARGGAPLFFPTSYFFCIHPSSHNNLVTICDSVRGARRG